MNVYTLSGKKLVLKEPAMASGGEGSVYEILGYPLRVAKIYHDSAQARSRESKIMEMVTISKGNAFLRANIARNVAWPLSPLFDSRRNFIGFGMNRITAGTELDDLYVYPPKQNVHITIQNKIDCLISLCDVIGRLHSIGQVFGDFNPNNIKVNADWTVSFVDADSYHVRNAGKEFRCVVCAPGYIAPEVIRACKGTTYANCPGPTFSKESDNFALAIHCFQMLMNGCHPFACQRQQTATGSAPAPLSTDKRIERGETPFLKVVLGYTKPDYAPEISALPPYIHNLFIRAFVDGHTNPARRPTAEEWKKALTQFKQELNSCRKNYAHAHWNGNSSCPYCDADLRYYSKVVPPDVQKKTAAIPVPAGTRSALGSSTKKKWGPVLFWIVTMLLSFVVLSNLAVPSAFHAFLYLTFDDSLLTLGMISCFLSGIIGTILYNRKWASGRHTSKYKLREYLFSLLTCLGFAVGFIIAVFAIMFAWKFKYEILTFLLILVFFSLIGLGE